MSILTCYRFLLGFYPNDFRRQFSDEMLDVFERRVHDRLAPGKTASIAFVSREFFSLLRGAPTMWMEKILVMKQKQPINVPVAESALSVVEIKKLREKAISRMVQAIATHDFPGARRYSEEEIRLTAILGDRTEPPSSQCAGAA
ncbi:MAG TPA: hypothetical protein VGG97_26295 [Bryobacteraceae bacterium]|jgi:hypothetical protein